MTRRGRHASIFYYPARAAPGGLPRRPPQRVHAGGVSRDPCRDRLWDPCRSALSLCGPEAGWTS